MTSSKNKARENKQGRDIITNQVRGGSVVQWKELRCQWYLTHTKSKEKTTPHETMKRTKTKQTNTRNIEKKRAERILRYQKER